MIANPGFTIPARQILRRVAWAQRFASILVIIAVWQIASAQGWINPRVLPAPTKVAATLFELTGTGTLGQHLLVSLSRVAQGAAIGMSVGLFLGIVSGLFRLGEEIIDSPVQAFRMLPHLALVPLFILWLGIGEQAKVALIALGTWFPIYLNVYAGTRNVDQRLVEAGTVFGLSRFGLLRDVILPGAMPQSLVGLRQALGLGWLSLVVAEQVNARSGLGFLMTDARELMRTDIIIAGLVVYAVLGLLTDWVVRRLERSLLAWRRGLVAA